MADKQMNFAVDLLPAAKETYDLGTGSSFWKQIYTKQISYNIHASKGSGRASNAIVFSRSYTVGTLQTEAVIGHLSSKQTGLSYLYIGGVTYNTDGTEALNTTAYNADNNIKIYAAEGKIKAATFDGNATTATTATNATNLASKPSLAASGDNITITAGNKTSDAFTVPYAIKADNDGNGNKISDTYLPLSGGKMTGELQWARTSLLSETNPQFFLVIDSFNDGGTTKYTTYNNARKALIGTSIIGSPTKPIYWNGSTFVEITSYDGNAATATNATNDGNGNKISTTYLKQIPEATSAILGGIKIGYSESGNNDYAVQLNNQQAYVNVPWTDEKVQQSNAGTATSAAYPILLANSASTTTEKAGVKKISTLSWNPATSVLRIRYATTTTKTADLELTPYSAPSQLNNYANIRGTKGILNISSARALVLERGTGGGTGNAQDIVISLNGTKQLRLDGSACFRPETTDIQATLGSSSLPWSAIYGSQVWGAVWNDYAEFRKDNPEEKELQQPGRCVREVGDGTLTLTDGRLQRGCEIISDTFGFAIGQDKENGYNTPIASSGRVLAYLYEDRELARNFIGWPVCSGPDGTVSIMTEEEENRYSNRIVGTISEIPDYEEWGTGKVKVDGRIWIRIK